MIDIRPVLLVIGILLIILGGAMLVPALVDLSSGNPDWLVFTISSIITLFFGACLWIANRGGRNNLTIRQAFLVTSFSWIFLAGFGALPLHLSELDMSFTDAYFEAMSGLTTTGATVLSGLDTMPPGILLWRSILQWLGGVGIVVMAVAVLPMLQIGGMQMFKTEAFDTSDKILPRATQISGSLISVYGFLTLICAFFYLAAGMSFFDAINHAMTTIATGGYSTHDASMGYYTTPIIQWLCIIFMLLSALPFLLYVKTLQGSWAALYHDEQVRGFFKAIIIFSLLIMLFLVHQGLYEGEAAFRNAVFNVTTLMTGTGYANTDYTPWGAFPTTLLFLVTFIGGCTGSTSCGVKIMRWQVMILALKQHIKRVAYPNGIFNPRYNGQKLNDNVIASVMSFIFIYFLCFMLISLALGLMGLDAITAISGAATAISNVGPGLGEIIGPAGNFSPLPDAAKWLLSFAMILGRLEVFSILILFVPAFWKN